MYGRYKNKYHAKKITIDGQTFDSKREYQRYVELELMQKAGIIKDLRRQVKYILVPVQYEPDHMDYSKSERGRLVKGKLIEREVSYYADFVYMRNGEQIVEDVKGVRTEVYKIKKKLMLYKFGIRVQEV